MVLASPSLYAKSTWEKMREWFNKKARSTTVKGTVESVDGRKVMFKTDDGQILQLTGTKVDKVVEQRGSVLSVFGNVRKPDGKFPTGGLEVRNFRVLQEIPREPVMTPVMPPEPEPIPEPIPVEEPEEVAPPEPAPVEEEYVEPAPVEPAVQEEPADAGQTYVVQKGDTLAKISKQLYGTTTKWKAIAEANRISNPKGLKVGMTLMIP
jgi:LysM repeat protein